MHVYTAQPLVSPVFPSELVGWGRLDSDDPMIETALNIASSTVFNFTKQDFTTRTWTLTFKDWPNVGTDSGKWLSKSLTGYRTRIKLPYTNLIGVDSVLINGEAETDFRIIAGKPYELDLDNIGYTADNGDALVVTYQAGYGPSTADVPEAIRAAVKMLAVYIINHNGACDASDALFKSGAKSLLIPYAVYGGITI